MLYTKSNFLAALLLPAASLVNGQLFTVNCAALTVQRSDPIVSPGVASGHVHAIIGGTAFQRTMSANTAVNALATTCDKKIDNSNYWVPQLYHIRGDGQFEIVQFQGSAVYYLNRACDYAAGRTQCPQNFGARSPPAGLRMLAGTPSLRTFDPNSIAQAAILHTCLRNGPGSETPGFPTTDCLRLRAEVYFPSCWDGVNLDSADHKSHMSYPAIGQYNGGVCPADHPIAIYSVFYEFFFYTQPFPDGKFVWAMGDPTGYGLHGDFINGWKDQGALDRAITTCQGPQGFYSPSCSINENTGSSGVEPLQVAAPTENIGLNGPIPALPGNNPVTRRSINLRSRIFGRSNI